MNTDLAASRVPLVPQPEVGGRNTGRIEQLSSFAIRYAEAQHVQFIHLYRYVIHPLLSHTDTVRTRVMVPTGVVIEAISASASEWTSALTALSGVPELRLCSMLPFYGAIAARRLISAGRRWCPQCLEDMADAGESCIYEPLVWRLSEVRVCPRHDASLGDTCTSCGRGGQASLTANARVGCCRHCGKWLGSRESRAEQRAVSTFERFCAEACEDLLILTQTLEPGQEILPSRTSITGLRDVFFSGNGSAMARRLGALPSMLNAYASGELPTPLHIYLRAAYVTGACLRQILVTQQFDSLQEAHTDTEFVLHRARSKASYKQELVDERLHEAIAGSGEMSVEAIARSLNLEPVTVWRRSGKLARQVAKKHARFVARRSAQKKAKFVEEVRALAKRYKSSGRLATQTDIKHELNDAGCGIDPWKRSVIDAILAETFGFRSPSREGLTGE